jgi:DNA-binding transcriptional regulator YiaG
VRDFLAQTALPTDDRDEILAAMKDVQINGLPVARHLRGDIYEVRATGARASYRVLFATEGSRSQVLLACRRSARRLRRPRRRNSPWLSGAWPTGVDEAGSPDNSYVSYAGSMAKDDLDQLIDELAQDDPTIGSRVAAALGRRELARQLAERRRNAGLTQSQLAQRMGTSQGQVTRFESGADTRLSTVARYAAAVGMKVEWTLAPLATTPRRKAPKRTSRQPSPA